MTRLLTLFAALVLAASAAGAQDPRLETKFSGETRIALQAILDSARAAGIPTEPIMQVALMGASKGNIPPARIVAASRGLAERMRIARTALGSAATEAELVAGASALRSGVEPATLEQIRKNLAQGEAAMPLIVLTDIIERGVARDTAAQVIISLGNARLSDAEYQSLRHSILEDIRSGAAPSAAAMTRMRGVLAGRGIRPPDL